MSSITADGDAVEVEHDVGPALVAALQRHLLGQREVVLLRVLPVDQMHRLVRLAGGDLHRHAVAQQLIGAQVGLIERDAGRVGGGLQLLQGGGNVRRRSSRGPSGWRASSSVSMAAVVRSLVPLAEVAVAEAVGTRWCR